jgi:hypothetical protein
VCLRKFDMANNKKIGFPQLCWIFAIFYSFVTGNSLLEDHLNFYISIY